ncbi:MAG: geranylgeranylglyceryl/heptaprenylglyceryl phosphate synthase [Flavobacteriaceae bacterium]|nr:geranylgeranylglyceryl/heptaprenylglyceryl phosphate synthase [Flavobacteriaceae bacterium]
MSKVYQHILEAKNSGEKLLAILLDPDKLKVSNIPSLFSKIKSSKITHVFVGGSTVDEHIIEEFVSVIKINTNLPIVLFPGDYKQLTEAANALLFLSLISGRNPEYLIEQQIRAVEFLKDSSLEIIPTGYVLIDGGMETAVQQVSETLPIPQTEIETIMTTALAGEYLGKKLIYLEAGSGALHSVSTKIISKVSEALSIPVIVGGGIKTVAQMNAAYSAGATMVVIGTAFEENHTTIESFS